MYCSIEVSSICTILDHSRNPNAIGVTWDTHNVAKVGNALKLRLQLFITAVSRVGLAVRALPLHV